MNKVNNLTSDGFIIDFEKYRNKRYYPKNSNAAKK